MTEKKLTLFVTTRPSRAGDLQEPDINAQMKKMLEESWAEKLGINVDKLRAGVVGTETDSTYQTSSSTISGTETVHNGVADDCTADNTTDSQTDQWTDDLHNDGGTGGIIDIPF